MKANNRIIRFSYRKIIGADATGAWEQLVFDSSYQEYRMQVQYYDPQNRWKTFAAVLQHNPAAEKLHFLVSASVNGYLSQLAGRIPWVLDNQGKRFLSFRDARFELINSSTEDRSLHAVAIHFYCEPCCWLDTIGDHLLVSATGAPATEDGILTNLVQLQTGLSVYSVKEN